MPDLRSQLRTYYQSVIWLRDPGDVIAGRTGGVTVTEELETFPTRRWWSQPAVVATAVALLALLMFGGGVLLGLRLGGGDDVADQTTTTATTTTIAALPRIEGVPVSVDNPITWGRGLVAVSAREVWAVKGNLIGHLEDGYWALWRLVPSLSPSPVSELTVAPDGTVWVAANSGVFSFDGVEWTRRFDDPVGSVGVDEGGTVWIGGPLQDNRLWLARRDGESWIRVDPFPQAPPIRFGTPTDADTRMAVLPDGEVWIVEPMGGWGGDLVMRYDGTRAESVECWEYLDPCPSVYIELAAAPNGDLLVGGFVHNLDRQYRVARFDGDLWTTWPAHDWPSAATTGASDMAVGLDSVLWFVFEGGLASVDGTEWTTRIEGPGVSAVDVAPDGTIWYADADGVHIFSTTLPAPVFGFFVDGLGVVDFGASPETVAAVLTEMFGDPRVDTGWIVEPTCPPPLYRMMKFGNGGNASAEELPFNLAVLFTTAEFFAPAGTEQFFGYWYNENGPIGRGPVSPPALTVGTTLAKLQELYPAVQITPDADLSSMTGFLVSGNGHESLRGLLTGPRGFDWVWLISGGGSCGE